MKYRKLRIAWSVAWGVVAVLLVVLWVRSYWIQDSIGTSDGTGYRTDFASYAGTVALSRLREVTVGNPWPPKAHGWRYYNFKVDAENAYSPWLHLDIRSSDLWNVVIHYGIVAGALVILGAIPWLRWRFSLRTLLIATTVVAVGLGLIAYLFR
jgi:hypothetical protein